jgi:hypothetical protein
MRKLLFAILTAFALFAQTPPAGTVTFQVVATGGILACTLGSPAPGRLHVDCTLSGATILTFDVQPEIGALPSGAVGSYQSQGNAITWVITRPTATSINWQVAANGTQKNGTF